MTSHRADILMVLHEGNSILLSGITSDRITNDQTQWIEATKADYQLVRTALIHYFSGEEIPSLETPSDDRWLKNTVILYERLYELIQFCWKPLKKSRLVTRAKERLQLRKETTPGTLLAFLLRSHFLAQIHECLLPYSEFSVSKQRRFLASQEKYPAIKPQQKKEFEVKCRSFLKDEEEFYSPLLLLLKIATAEACKSRRNSSLHKALERLRDHIDEMRIDSSKGLRRRNPYHWDKGNIHVGR